MLGTTKTLVVLMDQIIKKKEVLKMKTNKIQENHETHAGYIDHTLIDYDNSYRMDSKPNTCGCRLVYQNIVMFDGTVYELISQSTSTNGIFNVTIIKKGLTQKEVKKLASNAILY